MQLLLYFVEELLGYEHGMNLEFFLLSLIQQKIEKIKIIDSNFKILSIGMSDDYLLAIQNGSNMIRVGSRIFGKRNY